MILFKLSNAFIPDTSDMDVVAAQVEASHEGHREAQDFYLSLGHKVRIRLIVFKVLLT